MKNYVQPGEVMDITLTATKTAGAPVAVGGRIAVCAVDGVNGDVISGHVEGVFRLPKTTGVGTDMAQGVDLYLTSGGNITKTATGNTPAGYAFAAAAEGDATVLVKVNG